MAKSRSKTTEAVGDAYEPDVFDQAIADRQASTQVQQLAEATRVPEPAPEQTATRHAPNGHTGDNRHTAKARRRTHEHSKVTIPAGDMVVHYIDKGNNGAGIGIVVDFPQGAKGRPTDEEKEIIRSIVMGKTPDGYDSGFTWKRDYGMWHKEIGEDTSPNRAVAIRLDVENRTQKLADALRHHQADPVGYREQIKQEREQAANSERIPD